jgi:hypothetical protein
MNLGLSGKKAIVCAASKGLGRAEQLGKHWDYKPNNRPFIVNFLYVHSFPKRPNLKQLKDAQVIVGAPRGFEALTAASFNKLLELANADKRLIVD